MGSSLSLVKKKRGQDVGKKIGKKRGKTQGVNDSGITMTDLERKGGKTGQMVARTTKLKKTTRPQTVKLKDGLKRKSEGEKQSGQRGNIY